MESVYKLARGTVRLNITGAEPEKLLNLCAERGIELWDAEPKQDLSIKVTASASDYPEIEALKNKAMCEICLLSSRGGRRLGAAIKRRIGFGIGFALCVILLAVSSLYIWDIDIKGNSSVPDGRIIAALEESGLSYGSFRLDISSDLLRSEVLLRLPELSWISVNIRSSRAEVLVHERVEKPDIVDEHKCADVIAAKSGVITKVSALEGKSLCALGDTVIEGDTLISGTMDSETGDDRLVHARGEIEARTWYEISAVAPLYECMKTDSGKTERNIGLGISKKLVKISSDSRNQCISCDKIIKYKKAALRNAFVLPVAVLSEKSTERYPELCSVDASAAGERLKETLLEELQCEIGDGEIVEHNFSVINDGEKLTVTLRAECLEEISEEILR